MNVEEFVADDLDVQKAVVESLAADKAEQDLKLDQLKTENAELKKSLTRKAEEITTLRRKLEELEEVLLKNTERPESSQVTLLERSPEIDDRFDGEIRDHVIETLKEMRDSCEAAGRLRRAQILESVLVANEPTGELKRRREQLEKLFAANQFVINGEVINELDNLGILYKVGETYLLPKEIISRVY